MNNAMKLVMVYKYIYMCVCVCVGFIGDKINTDSLRLPSLAMPLFNRPLRGILQRFSRPPTGCNNGNSNHSVLINRQPQTNKDVNTHRNVPFLSTRSIVVVHSAYEGLWTHGTMVLHETVDHKGRRYNIQLTKTGHISPG